MPEETERTLTLKAQWFLYIPPDLSLINSTFCPQRAFMCFVCISDQTVITGMSLCKIK
jgi:hypothetical protein